jgi:hypothetical protein
MAASLAELVAAAREHHDHADERLDEATRWTGHVDHHIEVGIALVEAGRRQQQCLDELLSAVQRIARDLEPVCDGCGKRIGPSVERWIDDDASTVTHPNRRCAIAAAQELIADAPV